MGATFKYYSGGVEVSEAHYRNPRQAVREGVISESAIADLSATASRNVRNHIRTGNLPMGRVDGELVAVDRIIEYKKNPSLHKCGARCLNAVGPSCECSCGGANHGANR